jgi:hypothetical protein
VLREFSSIASSRRDYLVPSSPILTKPPEIEKEGGGGDVRICLQEEGPKKPDVNNPTSSFPSRHERRQTDNDALFRRPSSDLARTTEHRHGPDVIQPVSSLAGSSAHKLGFSVINLITRRSAAARRRPRWPSHPSTTPRRTARHLSSRIPGLARPLTVAVHRPLLFPSGLVTHLLIMAWQTHLTHNHTLAFHDRNDPLSIHTPLLPICKPAPVKKKKDDYPIPDPIHPSLSITSPMASSNPSLFS